MLVARTIADFRAWRTSVSGSLGLFPTLGYLHEGHLSLVRASKRDNAHTAASLFVNPMQFGANEDLDRYPRDEARDAAMLEREGVDVLFAPDSSEIYPQGFSTYVTVERLTSRLEGESRPTHFRGVTTVVMKLLQIIQPDRVYFGQKDAQQLAVIRRMVADLNVSCEIVGLPTVREEDGLALSSRNVYLLPDQRRAATVLNRSLRLAEEIFAAGERDAGAIRSRLRDLIANESLAAIDYISVADPATLEELATINSAALVSLAVRFGSTRLIDNTSLQATQTSNL
jgi:pantoate--beta-alanine ligase